MLQNINFLDVTVSFPLGTYPEVELLDLIVPFVFLWLSGVFFFIIPICGIADTCRSHALYVTHLKPES